MDITYLGHSSMRIRGRDATIITDPYSSDMVGLAFPKKMQADIITVSHEHEDHNAVHEVQGQPFIVRGPGEYEIKNVEIIGIPSFHDKHEGSERGRNTIYRISVDGIVIVHLGDLGHRLTSLDTELLNGVDVLLIPVGGMYTIGPDDAADIIKEIDPIYVIPMHFKDKRLNQKNFGSLFPIDDFLKSVNGEGTQRIPKLSIKKGELPEERQIVVLDIHS